MLLTKVIPVVLLFLIFILPVVAVPTTGVVTDLTPGQVTFHATGGSGEGWFQWGQQSGGHYIWSTLNQSVSGSFTDTQYGSPMLTGKTYYVIACDSTGCGSEVAFTVPAATPIAQTTYGSDLRTVMKGGFNLSQTIPLMVKPYTNQIGGTYGAAIIWGMLFMFIFTGYWMRTGDITIPMMLALLFGASMIWGSAGWGMPPLFMDIGIGLCAASLAGMFFSWFTK